MIDLDSGSDFNEHRGGSHWESGLRIVAAFAQCLRDSRPSPIDLELVLNMTLPGISAIESIDNGGIPIEIPNAG